MTGGIGLLKQREIVRFRELILDLDAGAVGKPSLAGADINRPSGLGPGAEAPGAAAVGQKIGLDNLRTAAAGLLFQPGGIRVFDEKLPFVTNRPAAQGCRKRTGSPPGSFGLYHREKRRGNIQKRKKDRKQGIFPFFERRRLPLVRPRPT